MREILVGIGRRRGDNRAPAVTQSSEIECAKTSGGSRIITSDPRQFRWYFASDMLTARFNDCVARRAALAPQPSPETPTETFTTSPSIEKSTRHRAKSRRLELAANNRRVPDQVLSAPRRSRKARKSGLL
jgi:hypothetical protein